MRHNKKVNHLGRKANHRKAMLSNMACSLIMHKRIETTLAKAKALRIYAEPLITKSKNDTTHSRRIAFSYLKDKYAVSELFREIAPKVADRPGGYTRVLKIGFRQGDAAEMAIIELVDFNETALTDNKKATKKTTRRSRAKKTAEPKAEVANSTTEEKPVAKKKAPATKKAESDTEKKPAKAKKAEPEIDNESPIEEA